VSARTIWNGRSVASMPARSHPVEGDGDLRGRPRARNPRRGEEARAVRGDVVRKEPVGSTVRKPEERDRTLHLRLLRRGVRGARAHEEGRAALLWKYEQPTVRGRGVRRLVALARQADHVVAAAVQRPRVDVEGALSVSREDERAAVRGPGGPDLFLAPLAEG